MKITTRSGTPVFSTFLIFIATGIILISLLCPTAVFAVDKTNVNIGLVLDGKEGKGDLFIRLLQSELNALLGSNHDIRMGKENIIDGGWSFENIRDGYDRLKNDPAVHIIVGAGALTGSVIAKQKPFKKPVIVLGIVDPVVQGLPPVKDNTSGIHNLTYILGNRSIIEDLETFHQVHPFKRLGFIYYSELSKTISDEGQQDIDGLMDRSDARLILIPVKEKIEDAFEQLKDVDAVYISYLGKFEGADKNRLIRELNQRKIPSFGSNISDTREGALAAMAPDDILRKVVRRISLIVEAVLEGRSLSDLKVVTDFEKNLTINMETATRIGFSPKFTILSQARLINEHYIEASRTVNLVDVMAEALQKNLDLTVSRSDVETAELEIKRAKTDYFPSLSAGVDTVVIDEERAEKSSGTQSETTVSGSLTATQLLYSDQVLGNIKSQDFLYQAAGLDHSQVELNVLLSTVEAYFGILKAKTSRKILKDNKDLIRQNLKTAQQREIIGYSGRSDVLRWKSQLATVSADSLAAKQDVILSKNNLNRILDREQDEPYHIRDTLLNDDIFSVYAAKSVEQYIDDQKSLDLFTRFYIEQCIDNSFEIKSLNRTKASIERGLLTLKRKYYLPTVNLRVNQDHIFSRSGEGSDVPGVDPVDDPWDAGIYLDLPFFEGGSRTVDIKKQQVALSRIGKQQAILAQQIENEARQAVSDAMVKMVNLELSRQAADFAKQNLELVQDSYAKGTVSVVELADAQNNALTSELSAISSTYDYLIALFRMEKVYGRFSLLLAPDSTERLGQKFRQYMDTMTE